jgi:hypothetical protein
MNFPACCREDYKTIIIILICKGLTLTVPGDKLHVSVIKWVLLINIKYKITGDI